MPRASSCVPTTPPCRSIGHLARSPGDAVLWHPEGVALTIGRLPFSAPSARCSLCCWVLGRLAVAPGRRVRLLAARSGPAGTSGASLPARSVPSTGNAADCSSLPSSPSSLPQPLPPCVARPPNLGDFFGAVTICGRQSKVDCYAGYEHCRVCVRGATREQRGTFILVMRNCRSTSSMPFVSYFTSCPVHGRHH